MSGADHDALRDAVFNAKTEAEFQAAQVARSAALWREVEQEMAEEELAAEADADLDAALASPAREGMSTAERDREIVDLYRRGASSCALGERFGVSASRVYQIAMRDAPELKTERGRGSKTMRRVRQRGAARAKRREYPPRVLYLLRHPIGPLYYFGQTSQFQAKDGRMVLTGTRGHGATWRAHCAMHGRVARVVGIIGPFRTRIGNMVAEHLSRKWNVLGSRFANRDFEDGGRYLPLSPKMELIGLWNAHTWRIVEEVARMAEKFP